MCPEAGVTGAAVGMLYIAPPLGELNLLSRASIYPRKTFYPPWSSRQSPWACWVSLILLYKTRKGLNPHAGEPPLAYGIPFAWESPSSGHFPVPLASERRLIPEQYCRPQGCHRLQRRRLWHGSGSRAVQSSVVIAP